MIAPDAALCSLNALPLLSVGPNSLKR